MQQHHTFVTDTMRSSLWHFEVLQTVRRLNLPDWAVGAGFVRNGVWDRLHGFEAITPLNDIDVLFFDAADPSLEQDLEVEAALHAIQPDRPWSVHNQARMHIRNNDRPYRSTADAISFWLETATGVAVHLDEEDVLTVIAPFGLSDLMEMRSGPTAAGRIRPDQYRDRMCEKNWPLSWPKVHVIGLD